MTNQRSAPSFDAALRLSERASAATISRHIYGHFAEHLGRCIYEGVWVGAGSPIPELRGIRRDVVAALTRLRVPVLRWPGGCFADEYHWRDGIGPAQDRPRRVNNHWGGVVETNEFGTHEFFDLCEQLGADAYVCGNVGSGSVREMMDWVEYMTSPHDSTVASERRTNGRDEPFTLPFFGVGNENWGCGGNMRPEYYADEYRRYQTFVKNYGPPTSSGDQKTRRVQKIACGANGTDYEWTRVLMERAAPFMDGLSLHWYTLPTGNWQHKGSATDFDEAEWHSTFRQTLRMDELIREHGAIMDQHDPDKRVGLIIDEWGTWYDVDPGTHPGFLYQQNTLRDALVAAINLNIFNQHAERVRMANIAQTVNVLQALVLTDKERLLLTPTFHVFEMYREHQSATLLDAELDAPEYRFGGEVVPALHASASRKGDRILLTLANLDPSRSANVTITGARKMTEGRLLTATNMNAHNTFAEPEQLKPVAFAPKPNGDGSLTVPSKSVLALTGSA